MELNGKSFNFGYFVQDDFYCNSQSFRDCPEAPINWILLLMGIVGAKRVGKYVPILLVFGPAPALPTLPVIRVIFPCTEECDLILSQPNCR